MESAAVTLSSAPLLRERDREVGVRGKKTLAGRVEPWPSAYPSGERISLDRGRRLARHNPQNVPAPHVGQVGFVLAAVRVACDGPPDRPQGVLVACPLP